MRRWLLTMSIVMVTMLVTGSAWANNNNSENNGEIIGEIIGITSIQEPAAEQPEVVVDPEQTVEEATEDPEGDTSGETAQEPEVVEMTPLEQFDAAISEFRSALADRAALQTSVEAMEAEVARLRGLLADAETGQTTAVSNAADHGANIASAREALVAAVDALVGN